MFLGETEIIQTRQAGDKCIQQIRFINKLLMIALAH